MNIQTGGGTLVHEIVLPFMEANFPQCPPWFNEGLGSLYEASSERDGEIIGLLNWRLKGLLTDFYRQFTTHAKEDPSGFETLKRVLKETDMTSFQQRWQDYVMTLKAP
jgi:hypothetical protein